MGLETSPCLPKKCKPHLRNTWTPPKTSPCSLIYDSLPCVICTGGDDTRTGRVWDLDERYQRLSASGDPLEKLNAIIAWSVFDKPRAKALKRPDGAKGDRPAYGPVLMSKILVLQALYSLSDDQAELVAADRLSFMRFLGHGLGDRMPDAKTIWLFREHLLKARAINNLFARFDKHLTKSGYLALSPALRLPAGQ
jgi:Transposase domain (DUF772)